MAPTPVGTLRCMFLDEIVCLVRKFAPNRGSGVRCARTTMRVTRGFLGVLQSWKGSIWGLLKCHSGQTDYLLVPSPFNSLVPPMRGSFPSRHVPTRLK